MTQSLTTLDNRSRLLHSPAITVAGSARAARWLSCIAQESLRPWQVRQLREGEVPHGLLVLTQPGGFPPSLHRRTAANQVVVSLDSAEGRSLALSNRVQTFTFSEGRDAADLTAKDLHFTASGRLCFVAVTRSALTRVLLDDPDDLYPALAALACAVWLGAPLELSGAVVSDSAAFPASQVVRMA